MIKKKHILLVVATASLLFVLFFMFSTIAWNRYIDGFESVKRDSELNVTIDWTLNNRGVSLVKTKSGRKVLISKAVNEEGKSLSLFLRSGDMILKEAKSDTFLVHREDVYYTFSLVSF